MMTKERVLIFLPCLTLGGAEKQGALLGRFMQSVGCSVEVWGFPSPASSGSLKPLLDSWGIPSREIAAWPDFQWHSANASWPRHHVEKYWNWPKQLRAYESVLPAGEFDAIVPFTFWPSLVCSVLPRRLKARNVIWNHRGGVDDAGMSYTPLLREQVLRREPQFVANSTAGAQFLRQTFLLQPDGVQVIRNAYAPELQEDESASSARTRKSKAVVDLLHVANFFPEKDADTVLDAMHLLRADGLDCRLHLVGTFLTRSDKEHVQRRLGELDIQNCVVLHGGLDQRQIGRLTRDADIGLLSSKSEGMPNSVMEYMYSGLPVIATDIPGIREVVGEANHQWLFPVGDAIRLKELVQVLAANATLRSDRGAANRERIISEFAVSRIMPLWLEVCGVSPTADADPALVSGNVRREHSVRDGGSS